MIELGKKQKLTVVKSVDFGVYLGEDMQADAKTGSGRNKGRRQH